MKSLLEPDHIDVADAKSDAIDMAQVHEAMNLAAALRNMPREHISAIGECLFCAEPLVMGERWCPSGGEPVEATCMAMWSREQERKRANGKA